MKSQEIQPVTGPINGTVRPPGSKSITNRALVLAALADGKSRLTGILYSKDTQVMLDSLAALGIRASHDSAVAACDIEGRGGTIPAKKADLWLENSGTSIRFLTSVCSLGRGTYRLDGIPRMRARPIGDLLDALSSLGASVRPENPESRCPPVLVDAAEGHLRGGHAEIAGDISSQFLSSLLMASPSAENSVALNVAGDLVSKPYVTMTLEMMKSFGVEVEYPVDLSSFRIQPSTYRPCEYDIEPDASAASYFFGAAAVSGGTVTVTGLTKNALQGDVEFATALQQMGCEVKWNADSITVTGRPLHGVDIDMNAISDTAQTLAAVAVFADSPTTIRGVEHMRHKETDRISAVVNELRRAGIQAEEFDDGMKIFPGTPTEAEIETYDDHRMAMSFSLLGLRHRGIRILDPDCTGKTYPEFFTDLEKLCRGDFGQRKAT